MSCKIWYVIWLIIQNRSPAWSPWPVCYFKIFKIYSDFLVKTPNSRRNNAMFSHFLLMMCSVLLFWNFCFNKIYCSTDFASRAVQTYSPQTRTAGRPMQNRSINCNTLSRQMNLGCKRRDTIPSSSMSYSNKAEKTTYKLSL